MSLNDFPHELLEAGKAFVSAIMPAAIGSAVAQAWEDGLSLRDRCIQWLVGICISYYVTLGISALLGLSQFAAQAVGFVVAMIGFKSTPGFITGCERVLEDLPQRLSDRFLNKNRD